MYYWRGVWSFLVLNPMTRIVLIHCMFYRIGEKIYMQMNNALIISGKSLPRNSLMFWFQVVDCISHIRKTLASGWGQCCYYHDKNVHTLWSILFFLFSVKNHASAWLHVRFRINLNSSNHLKCFVFSWTRDYLHPVFSKLTKTWEFINSSFSY